MKQAFEWLRVRARGFLQHKSSQPPALIPVRVVALVVEPSDRDLLRAAATTNQWHIAFANSAAEAQTLLTKSQVPVLVCDRDLLAPDWGSDVEQLSAVSPRTCILLVSKVADEYLWNEVVRRGGYDVLYKPLQQDELIRGVKLAWTYNSSAIRKVPFTK